MSIPLFPPSRGYGTVNHLLPLKLEEPVRFEITAVLLAEAMTLYIMTTSNTVYASAETDIFGRIMLTKCSQKFENRG
jgi:hypothetical protein